VAQARELIAQRNYNDAILILTTVVKEEPDRQDEAQELIGQIVRLRNQYNSDYETLIDLLYKDKDEAQALIIIAQLEALDKNPNKQVADDIKQAKRSARLISNNKRYRDIMSRALALLERKEYGQAVQVYLEGSDLAKDMFLESGFGNVLTNQVDRAWEDLKSASALLVQAEARLKALPAQGTTLLASEGSSAALDRLLVTIKDLATWRQRVWADGRLFRLQNEFLVKNSRQDDFFLSYSYLFVNGPPEGKTPEGILGAIDRLWADALDPWTAQIRTGVEARYLQAKTALDQGRYAEASAAFEGLRIRTRQGLDVIALWNRLAGFDETGAMDPVFRTKLNQILPLAFWLEQRMILASQGLQASKDLPQGASLIASTIPVRAGLELARAEMKAQKDSFASFVSSSVRRELQTQNLSGSGITMLDSAAFFTSWQTTWTGYRALALKQEAEFVDRRGSLDYSLLDGRFSGLQTNLLENQELVEGKVKYPLQATNRLEELRPLQDLLAKDLATFISLYDSEPQEMKTPAVTRWPVRGNELLARLISAQTLQSRLLTAAKANYAQSQLAKKQGQDLVAPVNAAIQAENFTLARSSLNQLSTRFSQSLALQEDQAFRSDSDIQVKTLFDLILKGENEVVVREVRRLITQGSQAYLDQQFQSAEQILLRARSRWATTNAETNSEVEYWLTLANYALSVTTGRELSPIDPLFNEVQQLLNFARRDYTLGQELLSKGQKAAGLELMKAARDVLGKILLPFPLNQEARLLNLEILKASDPENFPALFKQSFDAAVARIATDATTAYNDLQDLDKIQPNYAGMAAAIKLVRKRLNLDREAVDPKVIAQAKALVAQATRTFDGGNLAQLPTAQAQIRQALQLDPTNGEAQALFDKITLRLAPTVVTLTPSQVGELNEILDLLRAQRTLEALSRLTEFKGKYPGVANEARVKEAERRIKAVN